MGLGRGCVCVWGVWWEGGCEGLDSLGVAMAMAMASSSGGALLCPACGVRKRGASETILHVVSGECMVLARSLDPCGNRRRWVSGLAGSSPLDVLPLRPDERVASGGGSSTSAAQAGGSAGASGRSGGRGGGAGASVGAAALPTWAANLPEDASVAWGMVSGATKEDLVAACDMVLLLVADAARGKGNDPEMQRRAARALGLVASAGEEARLHLAEEGVVLPLMRLIRSGDGLVSGAAAAALGLLAQTEDVRVRLLKAGAAAALGTLCNPEGGQWRLATEACAAMAVLCADDASVQAKIARGPHLVPYLLELVRLGVWGEDGEEGYVDPDLQAAASAASLTLSRLASSPGGDEEHLVRVGRELGALDLCARVIAEPEAPPLCRLHCVHAVYHLVEGCSKNRVHFLESMTQGLDGLGVLLRVVLDEEEDANVAAASLRMLGTLADLDALVKARSVEEGVLEVCLEHASNKRCPALQAASFQTVAHLLCGEGAAASAARLLEKFVDSAVATGPEGEPLSAFARALTSYGLRSKDTMVCRSAVRAMMALSTAGGTEAQVQLLMSGAGDGATRLLERESAEMLAGEPLLPGEDIRANLDCAEGGRIKKDGWGATETRLYLLHTLADFAALTARPSPPSASPSPPEAPRDENVAEVVLVTPQHAWAAPSPLQNGSASRVGGRGGATPGSEKMLSEEREKMVRGLDSSPLLRCLVGASHTFTRCEAARLAVNLGINESVEYSPIMPGVGGIEGEGRDDALGAAEGGLLRFSKTDGGESSSSWEESSSEEEGDGEEDSWRRSSVEAEEDEAYMSSRPVGEFNSIVATKNDAPVVPLLVGPEPIGSGEYSGDVGDNALSTATPRNTPRDGIATGLWTPGKPPAVPVQGMSSASRGVEQLGNMDGISLVAAAKLASPAGAKSPTRPSTAGRGLNSPRGVRAPLGAPRTPPRPSRTPQERARRNGSTMLLASAGGPMVAAEITPRQTQEEAAAAARGQRPHGTPLARPVARNILGTPSSKENVEKNLRTPGTNDKAGHHGTPGGIIKAHTPKALRTPGAIGLTPNPRATPGGTPLGAPAATPGTGTREERLHAGRVPVVKFADLQIGRLLGRGAFGQVHAAKWRNQQVAVKRLLQQTSAAHTEEFSAELRLMEVAGKHANVMRPLAVCWKPYLCIVTELMPRGELGTVLGGPALPWATRLAIAEGTATGMAHLHSLHPPVIHRDLKPGNILLSADFVPRIADFGISREFNTTHTLSQCGTPFYMAPEVLMEERYDEKVDVYSYAVILWQLLLWRKDPYPGINPVVAGMKIAFQGLRPSLGDKDGYGDGSPAGFRALVEECWQKDPKQRPSFKEIVDRLRLLQNSLAATTGA